MDFLLRRQLSDATDDDVGPSEIEQVTSVVLANLVVFSVVTLVWEISRPLFPRIYSPRRTERLVAENRVPDAPSAYPLAWLVEMSKISEEDVLRMAGLDAYMFLRYIRICIRYCLSVTILGLIFIVPIYGTAYGEIDNAWTKFTLANVRDSPDAERLWVPVIFVYIYAAIFCHAFGNEYKHFLEKRADYFAQGGDKDTPDQTYYTVMAEEIPENLRTPEALREYFDALFPTDEVLFVGLTFNIGQLRRACDERRRVCWALEHAIAVWKGTGERPSVTLYPWSPYPGDAGGSDGGGDAGGGDEDGGGQYRGPKLSPARACLGLLPANTYDQIDHLAALLSRCNREVVTLQRMLYVDHNGSSAAAGAAAGGGASGGSGGIMEVPLAGAGAGGLPPSSTDGDGMTASLLHHSHMMAPDAAEGAQSTARDSNSNNNSNSNSNSSEIAGTGADSIPVPASSTTGTAATAAIGSGLVEGGEAIFQHLTATAQGLAREGKHTGLDAIGGVVTGLKSGVLEVGKVTVGSYYSKGTTAFVTFRSRVATTMACQMFLSVQHHTMRVFPAPDPHEILWENVEYPLSQIKARRNAADFGYFFAGLFWSVVVSFITAVSNLDQLSNTSGYTWLRAYKDTQLFHLLNSYLASLLLLIVLALLPLLFDTVARKYEGMKRESSIQNSIMTRYFFYQVVNVIVSVGLGSVLTNLSDVLSQPGSILTILGVSVPQFSVYFTNFLIVKAFTGLPLECLRIWPFIQAVFLKCWLNEDTCSWRELYSGVFAAPQMVYGWIYPSFLMVLLVVNIYSTIAPLLVPFALTYFCLAYYMYKYQLLYVYTNQYQAGGYMWIAGFKYACITLIGGILTLVCYLAIRRSFLSEPFYALLPLPVLVFLFMRHTEGSYRAPALQPALRDSREIDRDLNLHSVAGAGAGAGAGGVDGAGAGDGAGDRGGGADTHTDTDTDTDTEAARARARAFLRSFTELAFLQPELREKVAKPLPYRADLIASRSTTGDGSVDEAGALEGASPSQRDRKASDNTAIHKQKAGLFGSLVVSAAGAGAFEAGLASPAGPGGAAGGGEAGAGAGAGQELRLSALFDSNSLDFDSLDGQRTDTLELCERDAFLSDASHWNALGAAAAGGGGGGGGGAAGGGAAGAAPLSPAGAGNTSSDTNDVGSPFYSVASASNSPYNSPNHAHSPGPGPGPGPGRV